MTSDPGTLVVPPSNSLGDCPGHYASMKPDEVAVHQRDASLTWSELRDATERAARGMAVSGVGVGDIVTFALPNSFDVVIGAFACWMIGATPQVLSMNLTPGEFAAIVDAGSPRMVFSVDGQNAACPDGFHQTTVSAVSELGTPDLPLPRAISPSWKAPTSGGSTGRPKIIVSAAPGVVDVNGLLIWDIRPEDNLLVSAPMHHNSPFVISTLVLAAGGTLTLLDRFAPEAVLAEVARRRITWLYAVPTMMNRIYALDETTRRSYDVSSLRSVWHVGAPCPVWLKQAWIDWIGAEKIWEIYGGAESQAGTRINGTEWLEHRGSVGRPAWGELKILDESGAEAAPGEVGEVYLRSGTDAPSYHYIGAQARTVDGWETLGDVGYFDEDGYLYLKDRVADMILVGGENVYPAEIEAVLEQFPGVRSAAVIGLPDPDLGSRVHAIVEVDGAIDVQELQAHLGSSLSKRKLPSSIEQVGEPLRDPAGKMRRARLRAERTGESGSRSF